MDRRGYLAQLAWTWLTASLTMGTVAVLLVGGSWAGVGMGGFRTLIELSGLERLALTGLFGLLLAGLLAIAWRSADASWLTDSPRGRVLWALIVAAVGFAGWGYAATVTFVAGWTSGVQIALAYVGGGLPFALVAAMLLRPLRVNIGAGVAAVVLMSAGALVAGTSLFGVLYYYLYYLHLMFGGGVYVHA